MARLSEPKSKIEIGSKICCKCFEEKSSQLFSNDKSRKDGKNPRCKSCDAFYHKNRSTETREKEKARRKSGRYAEKQSIWRENNAERKRQNDKSWRLLNRDSRRSTEAKRFAKKKKATPPWLTDSQLSEIKNVYTQARDCELVSGQTYHVDHIVPLQGKNVCGLHVPWNLQVLPSDLNLKKRNSHDTPFKS
jgi:hypothetical protein